MDIHIYTKDLSIDLIPKIEQRFSEFMMKIQFHPDFQFDEQNDRGFCPIKLWVDQGVSKHYDHFGKEVLTGFELFFDENDYDEESRGMSDDEFIIDEKIDDKLIDCETILQMSWALGNKSEMRIALYFSAIVAELTDGIVYDPQSDDYFTGLEAIKSFPPKVDEYEKSIPEGFFFLSEFEKWS